MNRNRVEDIDLYLVGACICFAVGGINSAMVLLGCGAICWFGKRFMEVLKNENKNSTTCKNFNEKKITNGDWIRQMSNEELADYLSDSDVEACAKDRDHCKEEYWNCRNCWFEYLESEKKDG